MRGTLLFALAAFLVLPAAFAQNDGAIQVSVQKALKGSSFRNLRASVQDHVVTLTGSVDLYLARINAERRVSRVRGIQAIRDQIQISCPEIPDRQLQTNLEKKLATDRRSIYVEVHNGVVTVGGHAARNLHVFVIETIVQTKGVKGFHDVIEPGGSALDNEWPNAAPIGSVSTH
ncbi:MAG: BON domain-containing protein [Terracidiphilus sp.]